MRRLIRENYNKQKLRENLETLIYIIETNKKTNLIESIELTDVNFYEKSGSFDAEIKVKSWFEEHDLTALADTLKEIDSDIWQTIGRYEFDKNLNIKKIPMHGFSNLMWATTAVEWNIQTNQDLNIRFTLIQDKFRDE
jgi:hypothetical protein